MAEIVLSPLAAYDLEQILVWSVNQFGGSVAFAYMADIEAAIALLGEYPEAGELTRRRLQILDRLGRF
jgi:plasmid stabilization system protein ParE